MSPIYYSARPVCSVLLFLFTRWRVIGRDNIPRRGPVIVVSNHLNNADPPLVAAAVWPREISFMAKEELFRDPVSRFFVCAFGAFPVSRGKFDREAFRKAGEVLEKGMLLGLFPEGSRSKTGGLQAAMPGPALIARHFKRPILPVAIYGSEEIGGSLWFLKRPRVTINIGPAFELPAPVGPSRDDLRSATDIIMRRIAGLLPERYHGIYGNGTPGEVGAGTMFHAPTAPHQR